FGRHQNIDKQRLRKIGVPETVSHLVAFMDHKAALCFNNVRVNGVLGKDHGQYDLWFLLGLLNCRALDFVFRHTAKPKDRGYFEANKQFIAPLPIPKTRSTKQIANLAQKLADLCEEEAALRRGVCRRLAVDLAPPSLFPIAPELVSVPRKIERFESVPTGELLGEVEKFAKRRFTPTQRAQWDGYLTEQSGSLTLILRQIDDARCQLNDRVYHLFNLTSDEVRRIASEVGSEK
ncbi:MAG: TaqI-like C-terminal specificity domain-containing protein, partial [Planctomycetota bacterium]